MAERIEAVQRIVYTNAQVQPVKRLTKEETEARLAQLEKQAEERREDREYISRFPNTEHLSFAELLDRAKNGGSVSGNDSEDEGYILDISGKI